MLFLQIPNCHIAYQNEMLKIEVLIFLKHRRLYTNTHEQTHAQNFSSSSADKANQMDFRDSFWNSDYPTESDADRTAMFSRKGLRRSAELLLYFS